MTVQKRSLSMMASTDSGGVDYAERATRSVTVTVLPSITLAQVDKLFRAAGLPVEISFRLGKRAACVTLESSGSVEDALSLAGKTIQPKSSASLAPCVIEVQRGVVRQPTEDPEKSNASADGTAASEALRLWLGALLAARASAHSSASVAAAAAAAEVTRCMCPWTRH